MHRDCLAFAHLETSTEQAMNMEQATSNEWISSPAADELSARPLATPVTIARGDGIGPEIMEATLAILEAAGAQIAPEFIEIGEATYLRGHSAGIDEAAWASLRRTGLMLKGPITTPSGGGYKSLNVTLRKTLGLYANVRPCISYAPFVATLHPVMDLVIVRENEEDLYAGIEHQQTDEVVQCLKLITRPGTERIMRYAFEYTKHNNRKKLSCFTKDNIMKQTDGLFRQVFNEMSPEYPTIEKEHWIVDIGAAKLADSPEKFDVVVLPNLYGDILSDVAAQISGSVGMAGSANIGDKVAMFEAIHGSAPDIAGKNIANPSGLLNGAIMMLNHIGQGAVAEKIHNAWLTAIEEGMHTADIYKEGHSKALLNTAEFAEAVIERLGQMPKKLTPVQYTSHEAFNMPAYQRKAKRAKTLQGIDVFIDWRDGSPDALAGLLKNVETQSLKLQMITNRGIKVWPNGFDETFCTDHWRCRFMPAEEISTRNNEAIALLNAIDASGLDFIKTENLYAFDGKPAFSLGQGQ